MHRPGTDPANVQMADILCDFCRTPWTDELPVVEGHRGSAICGRCLRIAYTELVLNHLDAAPPDYTCTLCLEQRPDPAWQSPMHEAAVICKRCTKQAAGILHKDKDHAWTKPVG